MSGPTAPDRATRPSFPGRPHRPALPVRTPAATLGPGRRCGPLLESGLAVRVAHARVAAPSPRAGAGGAPWGRPVVKETRRSRSLREPSLAVDPPCQGSVSRVLRRRRLWHPRRAAGRPAPGATAIRGRPVSPHPLMWLDALAAKLGEEAPRCATRALIATRSTPASAARAGRGAEKLPRTVPSARARCATSGGPGCTGSSWPPSTRTTTFTTTPPPFYTARPAKVGHRAHSLPNLAPIVPRHTEPIATTLARTFSATSSVEVPGETSLCISK